LHKKGKNFFINYVFINEKIFWYENSKKKGKKREKTLQVFAEALPKSLPKKKFCGKSGSYF
jgi:hypothetical protein